MADAIGVCEDMENSLAYIHIHKLLAPAFITCFLYTILNAILFAVSFAMAARSKVYALCFRLEGEDAYHD